MSNDPTLKAKVSTILEKFLHSDPNTVLIVAAFESLNEEQSKDYLLFPEQRLKIAGGKFWLVRKMDC